jgi:hypothetical protein
MGVEKSASKRINLMERKEKERFSFVAFDRYVNLPTNLILKLFCRQTD